MRLSAVHLSFEGLRFADGTVVGTPISMNELTSLLGPPTRTESPSNTFHFYDGLGLHCLQDHASGLIRSVTFLLRPDRADVHSARGARPFSGELWVFGQLLDSARPE